MVMALTVEISSMANTSPVSRPAVSPKAARTAIAPTSTCPTMASIGAAYRNEKLSPR